MAREDFFFSRRRLLAMPSIGRLRTALLCGMQTRYIIGGYTYGSPYVLLFLQFFAHYTYVLTTMSQSTCSSVVR